LTAPWGERIQSRNRRLTSVSEQKTVNKRFLKRSPTYASKTSRGLRRRRLATREWSVEAYKSTLSEGTAQELKNFNNNGENHRFSTLISLFCT
jgi:hypothetical protein